MRRDPWRAVVVGGCLVLFLHVLPKELEHVVHRFQTGEDWVRPVFQILFAVGTVAGLWRESRLGYLCLFGLTVSAFMDRLGALAAVLPAARHSGWWMYREQALPPALELLFRIGCFGFLLARWHGVFSPAQAPREPEPASPSSSPIPRTRR